MNLPLLNPPKNVTGTKQWTKGTLAYPKEFVACQSSVELKDLPAPPQVFKFKKYLMFDNLKKKGI